MQRRYSPAKGDNEMNSAGDDFQGGRIGGDGFPMIESLPGKHLIALGLIADNVSQMIAALVMP